MSEPTLRGWRDDDVAAAAGLTERFFAPDPVWDEGEARALLTSDVMEGGAHVRVAERDGRVVGVAGYVSSPPWLYLWPVMGEDVEVAGALIDAVIAAGRAPGVERVRVSVRRLEPGKQAAVIARGFTRSIDFVEMVRASGAGASMDASLGASLGASVGTSVGTSVGASVGTSVGAARARELPAGQGEVATDAGVLGWRQGAAIEPARRRAMHATRDLSFAEIANTAPMSDDDFDHLLAGPRAWPRATGGLFAEDGTCAAFVIGFRHDDHAVVEEIGVHPAWRRCGLAAVLLQHLLAVAADEGIPEVRAMIASNNPGSLGLHAAAGFVERGRKELWDLELR
jgi:ribosomal protein S18 acetylase RimI-like enzyme